MVILSLCLVNHNDYIEAVGQDVKEEESKSIYEAEIKAVAMEEEDDEERYGKFEGYGSVFGNKDLGNDVIEKGAFYNSLKRKKPHQVKLLYQHKTDMPIGVFEEIKEDGHGLYVKGSWLYKHKPVKKHTN